MTHFGTSVASCLGLEMPGTSVLFRDGNEGLGPLLFLKGGLANTALNYSPFPGFCVFMIPLFVCVHYSFFCMFIIHFFVCSLFLFPCVPSQ